MLKHKAVDDKNNTFSVILLSGQSNCSLTIHVEE
jgi:hypothetical protein